MHLYLVQNTEQILLTDRLEQVVEGVGLQGGLGIVKLGVAAEDHDGQVGVIPMEDLHELHAAHRRHPDVGDDQIGGVFLQPCHGLLPVEGHGGHGEGGMLIDHAANGSGGTALVFYDQYFHGVIDPFNVTMVPVGILGSMVYSMDSSNASRRRTMVLARPRPPALRSFWVTCSWDMALI